MCAFMNIIEEWIDVGWDKWIILVRMTRRGCLWEDVFGRNGDQLLGDSCFPKEYHAN